MLIRRTVRKIKNIVRWIPILWHDEDWDYFYIYNLLQNKLLYVKKHILEQNSHLDSKHVASRIQTAINLIDKVKTEYYIDDFIEKREMGSFSDEELIKAFKKHEKARKVLFQFLSHNLHHWWE